MSERRAHRGIHRTDRQILSHIEDMHLLELVACGEVVMGPEVRTELRRLALDDLIVVGFGTGARPLLLRGQRLLSAMRGEYVLPDD